MFPCADGLIADTGRVSLYKVRVSAVCVFTEWGWFGLVKLLENMFLYAFLPKENYLHIIDGLRVPSSKSCKISDTS